MIVGNSNSTGISDSAQHNNVETQLFAALTCFCNIKPQVCFASCRLVLRSAEKALA